ncbi:2-dehydro-3-deoxy-6-phosphogalactonate aldolase [Defluviimonas aquaemixtae]|uniref:2-dehydro-3-deoxy-6-phosphogalactonate aldolase n=1 Tax=Albidovulum aquaemixtae TaxID=1542388 RepID=A0A2R8B8G9_9RHOB|nr:2-dehydro-3-deoxy-6-phosphogalactonate aldolase [Defluviimonas aquaemixtae]SPH18743.1 2-dehydro-3-deoxy-6-phosphogalactonate aldolase [Defluviimonas aquaemixtae]
MTREIIAILRGIRPDEAEGVTAALIRAGITRIEVPLNSPEPFVSIKRMCLLAGDRVIVGAGTVLTVEEVDELAKIGAQMVVSPDCNPEVIRATKAAGLLSYPGVFTPTECFAALRAGADGIKIFPASQLSAAGLSAIRAVLPQGTRTYAVGGVGPNDFAEWHKAGVTGFGIGAAVYKSDMTVDDVAARAHAVVTAYDAVFSA